MVVRAHVCQARGGKGDLKYLRRLLATKARQADVADGIMRVFEDYVSRFADITIRFPM